jgi:hypothetical protein
MSTQQRLKKINLKDNERKALRELKERLLKKYPGVEIILYGSKARGDFDKESDIDLLRTRGLYSSKYSGVRSIFNREIKTNCLRFLSNSQGSQYAFLLPWEIE